MNTKNFLDYRNQKNNLVYIKHIAYEPTDRCLFVLISHILNSDKAHTVFFENRFCSGYFEFLSGFNLQKGNYYKTMAQWKH